MFEYGKRNRAAENWVEFIFLEIDNIRPLSIVLILKYISYRMEMIPTTYI